MLFKSKETFLDDCTVVNDCMFYFYNGEFADFFSVDWRPDIRVGISVRIPPFDIFCIYIGTSDVIQQLRGWSIVSECILPYHTFPES